MTASTARYPFEVSDQRATYGIKPANDALPQITLHQGAIENIFLDSMAASGVVVDRPIVPTAIELSKDEDELHDPHSYPVTVINNPRNVSHSVSHHASIGYSPAS